VDETNEPGFARPVRLCHVCGSTDHEQIDESHIRCVECGQSATFTRLAVVGNPNPSRSDIAEADARFRVIDARTLAAFVGAPFRPLGLDDRWRGLRWFGGHGGTPDLTTDLTLAFGDDPLDPASPEIRVETRLEQMTGLDDPATVARIHAFMLAKQQVDHLWRATGVLRDDVRQTVFARNQRVVNDPTESWEKVPLIVDGEEIEFATLREGAHWVAQAIIGATVVAINARQWAVDATGLVAVDDFAPYQQGAQEVRRRMRLRGHG
jgi:hypothetical protein